MKRTITVIIALFTLITSSYSQDEKGFIGISLGPSIPIGDFASKDKKNSSAGGADPGAVFDLSFSYKLGESNFGITGLLHGQANPYDPQVLIDDINNKPIPYNTTIETKNWEIGGFMLGGFGSFPITQKISFDTRAMIGYLKASYPEYTLTLSNDTIKLWRKHESVSTYSFSYLVGAGLKFDVGKKIYLLTNVDYFNSNPEFTDVSYNVSNGDTKKATIKRNMNSINLSVGIALKLQ